MFHLKKIQDFNYMTTPFGNFKTQLNRTFNDVESWTSNPEMEKYKLKIQMGLKVNVRDTVELFMDSITPYANEILLGNDEFFLSLNSSEIEGLAQSNEIDSLINTVKLLWKSISIRKQKQLKNHFKLLIMLGAIATSNETLRQIINKHRHKDNPLTY